jgi:hypothetical protein
MQVGVHDPSPCSETSQVEDATAAHSYRREKRWLEESERHPKHHQSEPKAGERKDPPTMAIDAIAGFGPALPILIVNSNAHFGRRESRHNV